jgi:two-component system chemotaxis sensor kinase CheA
MHIDLARFHSTFFEESFERLDAMESNLLRLDLGAIDSETINTIFREVHSIKGASGTFGFSNIADFTHVMETLLGEMRDGEHEVTRELVDTLLESVDCVRGMLSATKAGDEIDRARVSEVQQRLEALLHGEAATKRLAVGERKGDEDNTQRSGWRIRFHPHLHMLHTGNDPYRLFRELDALGELSTRADVSGLPPFADLDPEACYLGWALTLKGNVAREQIGEIFTWVEGDCDLEITPFDRRNRVRGGRVMRQESSSIRVSIDKVDGLVNLAGELVITQSMLSRFSGDFDPAEVGSLRDGLTQLGRNTRELQENVMRIRMLPISFCFDRLPRLVHDVSHHLGKKVELKLSGEQTELDKTVLEKIGDPLMHLVRNSLGHGIEHPQVRRAAGKPETGVVHLNAYHSSGNIVIEVSDDGAGLDKDKILQRARDRGLVGDDEQLSDERIHKLIFDPGFSTADDVSGVSGRGVGMDVVRRNVKDLGGHVEVHSDQGKGSTVTIRLPLTLAILDGLALRVGRETYIVSLLSVAESIQIDPEQVNTFAGKAELYKLRDEYIPIIRLYEMWDVKPDTTDLEHGLLVVVESDAHRVALFVDDLLGQQQVVIKSLQTNFKPVQGLSGATILGDGTVALILDVPGLIQRYFQGRKETDSPTHAVA